ncbi:MAG: ribonuclease G, partial [Pseudomonadota bacterium]
MKGRVLILGNAPNGAPAAALLVDGRLEDYLQASHDTDPTPAPGQIFVGQVARSGGKGAGAFVTLAHGQQGFLRDGSGLKEGRR